MAQSNCKGEIQKNKVDIVGKIVGKISVFYYKNKKYYNKI